MRNPSTLAIALCALVGAGPALAADYDDDATGNWQDAATWSVTAGYWPGSPPAGADTATLDSAAVTVTLDTSLAAADVAEITLAGGHLKATTNRTIASTTIHVPGACTSTVEVTSGSLDFDAAANVAGWGRVDKTGAGDLRLYEVNSAFAGRWDAQAGTLYAYADGALGSGTTTVNGGRLWIRKEQTSASSPHTLILNSGTLRLYSRVQDKTITATDWNIALNGGTVEAYGQDWWHRINSPVTVSGTVTLTTDFRGTIKLYGPISGAGKLVNATPGC